MADVTHDLRNQFGEVKNRTESAATGVVDKARETVNAAGQRVESAVSAVGSGINSLAGSIRENMPREGMIGNTSERVASTLETGGRYLQDEGLTGMMDDLSRFVRRNPLPALLVGIGIGFILARTFRK
jgi:hypothetical protein